MPCSYPQKLFYPHPLNYPGKCSSVLLAICSEQQMLGSNRTHFNCCGFLKKKTWKYWHESNTLLDTEKEKKYTRSYNVYKW